MSVVSVVKGNNPEAMLKKAVEWLGGLNPYVKQSQKIFIKPNVCGGIPGKPGSFTSPRVLESMIKLLREMDLEVWVGEADSCMYTADVMLSETGIGAAAMRSGAKVVNLSHDEIVKVDVSDGYILKSLSVNKAVADADVIISMPVMKTHACTMITLGMKTMFGILPERKKSMYHPRLDHVMVDIVSALKPRLTVIDGIIAMEGEGPLEGDLVELGLIIAGNNVVSTDACAAAVMGFNPASIDHLRLASEKGLGTIDLDEIEIRGESIDLRRPFIQATPEKRDRLLCRVSKELGYIAIHRHYEKAVRTWKRQKR